jgi:ribulose bisphosphate carboxylase small subunit
MLFMSRKPLAAILMVLCAFEPTSHAASESPPPLKLIIAIPQRYGYYSNQPYPIELDDHPTDAITGTESHFDVLIENISKKPVFIFNEDNSEGCETLSLVVTKPDGTSMVLHNEIDMWITNNISLHRLLSGECQVREVYYATNAAYLAETHVRKPFWHAWGTLPFLDGTSEKVTIQAIFHEKNPAKKSAWSGEIKSEPIEVTLNRAWR